VFFSIFEHHFNILNFSSKYTDFVPFIYSVECGSLICEECAGYHIRLNRRTSSILSLDESNWSLPQILSVLEGGNQNFLSALNKVDRQNDYLRKSRRGFGVRNLMTENEKDCHPFKHRYKYNTKVESYKAVLASRVADACKENAGAKFAEENTTKIIPEGDINNGSSLATYLVHKSKNGKLKGDEPTCSLLKENEPNGSQSRQKSSFKGEKRSKSKSTRSSESKAVNNFFHRRIQVLEQKGGQILGLLGFQNWLLSWEM